MKYFFSIIFSLLLSIISIADEGMWLPHLLKIMNQEDMEAKGLQLTAEELYSVNNSSLKDAIVSLGGFCTAEVISSQGLLLTNHHCGYDAIQNHSSVQNDYLKNGFWAKNNETELINPDFFVDFLIKVLPEDKSRIPLDI